MKQVSLIFIAVVLTGCAGVASELRPNGSYYAAMDQSVTGDFLSMDAALSDREIDNILNYRVKLPEQSRIAILNISDHVSGAAASRVLTTASKHLIEQFIGTLEGSAQVYDAAFLPTMLVPKGYDAAKLRVAAARFQADLVLIYRTSCQSFHRQEFFADNQTKAYCSVESVVLDVRSGIVPFSMVTSESFSAAENQSDMNFYETIEKAKHTAVTQSLVELAAQLVNFLEQVNTYEKG